MRGPMQRFRNFSSPNPIIILSGVLISVIFILIALNSSGLLRDLSINFAAGVATVVLTVILVDMLRTSHKKRLYLVPRHTATARIKNAHFSLIFPLAMKHFRTDGEILKKFVEAGEKQNMGDSEAMGNLMANYAERLGKLDSIKLLGSYTDSDLESLQNNLSKLRADLEGIRNRYSFSFLDVDFNSSFVNMMDNLDGSIDIFVARNINTSDLNRYLKPVPGSDNKPLEKPGLYLISITLKAYLNSYVGFINQFGIIKEHN